MQGVISARPGVLWLVAMLPAACTVSTVDPQGRPCSPTVRCGPGYSCDPTTSTCVLSGDGDAAPPDVDVLADAPSPDMPDTAPADGGDPFGQGAWQLGPPELVEGLNSSAWDGELSLSADGLTAYFASRRKAGIDNDIYVATRSQRFGLFTSVSSVSALNTGYADMLTVSADGLTGFLASNRPGGAGSHDIWIGTRAAATEPWNSAAFKVIDAIGTAESENDPMPSADVLQLYFAGRNVSGGSGGQDVVVSTRSSATALFGSPQAVAGINSTNNDADPTLSPDGRVIVFASSRAGGSGKTDLWYATRSAGSSAFSEPKPVPTINTSTNDGEPLISPDGLELYFASDRPGGQGDLDIYCTSILKGP
jgi:hypothetical protein